MSQYNTYSADKKPDFIRAERKHFSFSQEPPAQKRGDSTFYSVEYESKNSQFYTETAQHVHCAGVTAAFVTDVAVFEVRNYYRNVDITEQIRAEDKRNHGYVVNRHYCLSSLRELNINFIGVPEKSKDLRK